MITTTSIRAERTLDRDALLALVNGDQELLRRLVDSFFTDYPRWLADIEHGIRHGKLEQVRRAAHSLVGGAATFHARAVQLAAGQLETVARDGHLTGALQLYRQFSQHTPPGPAHLGRIGGRLNRALLPCRG